MDAYTLRKIAPRILIGVIGINLSIYLCVAAIDITNIVGRGMMELLAGPFNTEKLSVDAGSGNVAAILTVLGSLIAGSIVFLGAGGGSGFLGILLMLVLTIMLLVLSIMITLAIRQTLLVLLTVLSPVAIALFILPGTEKYFRQWWDLFLRTLMVYPIIAALFAVSGIMATISFESTNVASNLQGAFQVITGLVLIFIPLFMIPFAFRMAGGAIGSVFNAANGMRSQFAGWNRDRLNRANQDPDKLLNRSNRAIGSRVTDAQFAARRGIAKRNFLRNKASRDARLQALAGQQEIKHAALAAAHGQSTAAKATAQIDEAQMDMAKYGSSAASLAAIADGSHLSFSDYHRGIAQRINAGEDVSTEERESLRQRQNQLRMYSAMNDRAGRSKAARIAAAKSAPALSYGYAEGEKGWNQAVSIAEELFDDDSQVLSHLNELQYVASQVGRSDLSGNVNSKTYDQLRAGGKVAGAQVMSSGKPSAVAGIVDEQIKVLERDGKYEEKLQAARILADLRSSANSPYATAANKEVLAKQEKKIKEAFKVFSGSPEMQQQAASSEQAQENIFAEAAATKKETVPLDDGREIVQHVQTKVSGSDAAEEWFEKQSGQGISQADIEEQQRSQADQQNNENE